MSQNLRKETDCDICEYLKFKCISFRNFGMFCEKYKDFVGIDHTGYVKLKECDYKPKRQVKYNGCY